MVDGRNRFDFNQPFWANRPADDHERACGGTLSVDVLVVDFSDLRNLRRVDAIKAVKIELDDVVKISSGGFDCCF